MLSLHHQNFLFICRFFCVDSHLNKKFTIAVLFPSSSLLFNSFANVKAIALKTEQVRIMVEGGEM
jgi:hypothetical protein